MMRYKPLGMTVPVVLAVAIILAVGGGAIASNMGFKMNKALTNGPLVGANDNWTSIPYNNPYGTFGGFCNQTGLRTVVGSQARITKVNPANNAPTTAFCGTGTANTIALPTDGTGILIEQPVNTGSPTNIIIVGSHNPTLATSFPPFCNTTSASPVWCTTAPVTGQGEFWFSVPYHTTAVTMRDLCVSANLHRALTATASLTSINAATGAPRNATCAAGASTGINLVLGEALRIREVRPAGEPVANISFIPAHY